MYWTAGVFVRLRDTCLTMLIGVKDVGSNSTAFPGDRLVNICVKSNVEVCVTEFRDVWDGELFVRLRDTCLTMLIGI